MAHILHSLVDRQWPIYPRFCCRVFAFYHQKLMFTEVKKRLHKIDKLNALHHEKLEGSFLQFLLPALAPLAVDMFKNLISGRIFFRRKRFTF